ncbi:achaete-scute homolog 4-like [Pholidichthys leucotaenia]
MSYHRKDIVESQDAPFALHSLSVDHCGAHFKDALRLGLPFHLDPACFDQMLTFRRLSCLPLHGSIGVCEFSFEPAFIRKRNERERHRVRCVNDGYARLRERLPREFDDKRLSKVETLRAAIGYIKQLQGMLDFNACGTETSLAERRSRECPLPPGRTECQSDGECGSSLSDGGEAGC